VCPHVACKWTLHPDPLGGGRLQRRRQRRENHAQPLGPDNIGLLFKRNTCFRSFAGRSRTHAFIPISLARAEIGWHDALPDRRKDCQEITARIEIRH